LINRNFVSGYLAGQKSWYWRKDGKTIHKFNGRCLVGREGVYDDPGYDVHLRRFVRLPFLKVAKARWRAFGFLSE
jgi:hypothetical protein